MVISAQFTIAKCLKKPKCPSVNEWIKKLCYTYAVEYYAAERKKEPLTFRNWIKLKSIIDGIGEHYAK